MGKMSYKDWKTSMIQYETATNIITFNLKEHILNIMDDRGDMMKREEIIEKVSSEVGICNDRALQRAVSNALQYLLGTGIIEKTKPGFYKIST